MTRLAVSLLALFVAALPAQQTPPAPQPQPAQEPAPAAADRIATATLEELVATIEDPAARQKLVAQLQALIALRQAETQAEPTDRGLLGELSRFFASVSQEVSQTAVALIDQLALLPQRVAGFVDRLADPEERRVILADALTLGGILLATLLAAAAVWYLARRLRRRLYPDGEQEWSAPVRTLRALGVLVADVLPPAAMLAVTLAGLSMFPATESGTALLLALVSALAIKRLARAGLDFLLAPRHPALRTLPVSDELARPLARSLDRLLALGIYGFFALEAVAAAGADRQLLDPLRSLYGLALLLAGIFVVLKYRRAGRQETEPGAVPIPRPETAGGGRRWQSLLHTVLGLWWIGAIVYMTGLYSVWISRIEGGFAFALKATALTAVILAGAGLAAVLCRRLIEAAGGRARSLLERLPLMAQRVPRYVVIARGVANAAILVLAAGLVLNAWGIGALEVLGSEAVQNVIGDLLGILLVVLIAAAAIDVATALTQGYLTRTEQEGRASGKVRTLVPLAQKTIKFFVFVIAGITVLSQLGVNIGPILAGVGVLGLAIGFGAQTLVKDIITGAFILIEDAVAVGDVVDIDGTGGAVEAISIRTIRLRDLSGNVHTIPFSSVGKVTNMTKGFSRYVVEAAVAYREDVDEVIALLEQLGAEMQKDPVFGRDIIAPIEILGLDRFEDSAVVIRARLITRPARQWAVGREFNRRMKRAFDEAGIEIPFPHRTIYMGEDKEGKAPPLRIEEVRTEAGQPSS